jgi:hypothetical protein
MRVQANEQASWHTFQLFITADYDKLSEVGNPIQLRANATVAVDYCWKEFKSAIV